MSDPLTPAPLLILFGISGVGKTTAANAMVNCFPCLLHVQASTLLKSAHGQSGEVLRTASSDQIGKNQIALAGALAETRKGRWDAPVLLDAHNVIDNDQGIVELPLETFAALEPRAIAFLYDDPQLISDRRKQDARLRPTRTPQQLEIYQHRAQSVAGSHAAALGVPFMAVRAGDHAALARFLSEHICAPPSRRDSPRDAAPE